MTNRYKTRFVELAEQMERLRASKSARQDPLSGETIAEIDSIALLEWKVKAKNLVIRACGADSEHYKEFIANEEPGFYGTYRAALERLRAVYNAAREDYEGGYLHSIRALVRAEVYESELEQARELLVSGYSAAAAVVAGVVLETALRALCDREGIGHGKMDRMNADLAKSGVYSVLQQKRITTLADIRNSAAHGNQERFVDRDVEDMIRDVTRFVEEYLE